jgi:hypothetical protein
MKPRETIELSIIIVNWNSVDYLINCLRSIQEETSAVKYEIIVVDNASFDGCAERLATEFPEVKFIQSEINLGFARANNLGASRACGEVLLFLNPDTEIKERAIERLYECICALPDCGIIGAKLLNSDGSIQTTCIRSFPTILNQVLEIEWLRRHFPKSSLWGTRSLFENTSKILEVNAVSGACLMIKRDIFEAVGMFSTSYFMYSEDIDLCLKVHRIGKKVYFCPQALVVHHSGKSSDQASSSHFSSILFCESRWRFFRKHKGPFYASMYRFTVFFSSFVRMLILLIAKIYKHNERSSQAYIGMSLKKWLARFRWSIFRENWVTRIP